MATTVAIQMTSKGLLIPHTALQEWAKTELEAVKSETGILIRPKSSSPQQAHTELGTEASAAIQHFLSMDTSRFTAVQRQTYNQACVVIQKGRLPGEPRVLGLLAELMQIADDFDDPLPDEDIFWGKETDEYGMSFKQ